MFTPFVPKPSKAIAAPEKTAAKVTAPTRSTFSGFVPAKPAAPAPVPEQVHVELIDEIDFPDFVFAPIRR